MSGSGGCWGAFSPPRRISRFRPIEAERYRFFLRWYSRSLVLKRQELRAGMRHRAEQGFEADVT